MRETYHQNLETLKSNTIKMGETSLEMLNEAIKSIKILDHDLARRTIKKDEVVDAHEGSIDRCVSHLIALQQPMASDLRLITSCLSMAIDMERLSDLASNIAWVTLEIENDITEIEPLISEIITMGDIVENMLTDTITAFKTYDAELAKKASILDDKLDKMFFEAEKQHIQYMIQNPGIITDASHLLFVLRYLERIGDHICNICQSIVYVVTGERTRLN